MKKANEGWKAMSEEERAAFARSAQEEEGASIANGPQDKKRMRNKVLKEVFRLVIFFAL